MEFMGNTHQIRIELHRKSIKALSLIMHFSAFSVVRPQLVETFVKFVVKNIVQLLQYLLYHSEHTYT